MAHVEMFPYSNIEEFLIDSEEDLENLPECPAGSVAKIAGGKSYRFAPSGEWKEVVGGGSKGGDEGGGDEGGEDEGGGGSEGGVDIGHTLTISCEFYDDGRGKANTQQMLSTDEEVYATIGAMGKGEYPIRLIVKDKATGKVRRVVDNFEYKVDEYSDYGEVDMTWYDLVIPSTQNTPPTLPYTSVEADACVYALRYYDEDPGGMDKKYRLQIGAQKVSFTVTVKD